MQVHLGHFPCSVPVMFILQYILYMEIIKYRAGITNVLATGNKFKPW